MWTKAHSEHQTSTKSTSCVDRRLLFPLRIHKRYPFCGQKPSPGTKLPQKCTSCVDRRLLFPLRVHKRYPFCGQKSPPDTGLPQKCPRLWTKVPSRHQTSTKMPPPVDKSPLPTPDFHKNAPACGQKSPPGTKLPQKCPRLWTKVPSRHQTSTKSTLCVDRRQLFLSGDTTGGAAGDTTGGAFTCREEGIKNYLV